VLLEVDMKAVGSFEAVFAGPPVRKEEPEHA
jgi:acetolactate synthase-1/2/3 large subunit